MLPRQYADNEATQIARRNGWLRQYETMCGEKINFIEVLAEYNCWKGTFLSEFSSVVSTCHNKGP